LATDPPTKRTYLPFRRMIIPELHHPDIAGTLLLVDDAPENLVLLEQLLGDSGYRVRTASSGRSALFEAGRMPHPDLILLDVVMPEMDGYEVIAQLRSDPATRNIPVIFLTGLDDAEQIAHGLSLGAADYITKPIQPPVVLARVRAQLDAGRARAWLRDQNVFLEREVARRMEENDLIQRVTIRALAHLAETRDLETGNHILRTEAYVRLLATRLSDHPRFRATLDEHYIQLLVRSAPLHDIGKVGIPDQILRKPGRLTPDEWAIMQTHAQLGADSIEMAERDIERPLEFLTVAKDIARWHHERWDGSGYPDQLAGESIPAAARLMALADVFDALISPRVYKQAYSLDRARDMIMEQRGRHFDPDVADVFADSFDDFAVIARRYDKEP
jgi:putative two-component system response regulator